MEERFDCEMQYQAAQAVARSMLQQGIISGDDLRRIQTMLEEKYRPFFGAIPQE